MGSKQLRPWLSSHVKKICFSSTYKLCSINYTMWNNIMGTEWPGIPTILGVVGSVWEKMFIKYNLFPHHLYTCFVLRCFNLFRTCEWNQPLQQLHFKQRCKAYDQIIWIGFLFTRKGLKLWELVMNKKKRELKLQKLMNEMGLWILIIFLCNIFFDNGFQRWDGRGFRSVSDENWSNLNPRTQFHDVLRHWWSSQGMREIAKLSNLFQSSLFLLYK